MSKKWEAVHIGAAGDMSSMSGYFATVFRLARSTRAASDLERPAASIDRISFTVSRGAVISPVLPGRARQSDRPGKPYGEGRAPGPRGAALLLKLLIFSCSRCSFPSDHSDHFLANINTHRATPPWKGSSAGSRTSLLRPGLGGRQPGGFRVAARRLHEMLPLREDQEVPRMNEPQSV